MSVLQLIDEMRRKVGLAAAFGTRWRAAIRVEIPGASHQVTVAARIDHKGRRREQFLCDGTRVEHGVLLRLTCAETECPQAKAVRQQWVSFHQRMPARNPAPPPQARPLIEEVSFRIGHQQCTARPARFPCYTRCPNRAHPSLVIDKTGYDLFEHGAYLGGGVVTLDGAVRPRLPTIKAAEAFVLARQLEVMAALSQLRSKGAGPSAAR